MAAQLLHAMPELHLEQGSVTRRVHRVDGSASAVVPTPVKGVRELDIHADRAVSPAGTELSSPLIATPALAVAFGSDHGARGLLGL